MLHLGLTGGIGSGKSTVARMFAELGAVVIDADVLVRHLLGPGREGAEVVLAAFGLEVMAQDGSVDRKVLAAKVFGDEAARRRLEAILHPLVVKARRATVEKIMGERGQGAVVISEAALIFEAGTASEFDGVVLVTAPTPIRTARLASAGWEGGDIGRRMAAQWPDERKAGLADWVVDNGGSEDRTRAQVEALWARFQAMALARKGPISK